MNMHALDWGIVIALVLILIWGALSTRRYTGSVAAFLAADRCGGRYLISVACEMSKLGVITLVWYFEQNYKVGYTPYWWGMMEGPALIIMALSGWVIYRYRQTRAMTLAQFFEMRYSRRFRVFAGLVAYLAGIINFGIFPSVGARFFIAMCGLPESLHGAGIEVSTFPLVMFLLLSVSLAFTFLGGQIAVMVTDFLQGTFCNIAFAVLVVFLLFTFNWDQISQSLLAAPQGESLVHPFHLGKEKYFDFWFYVIGIVIFFYGALGWQGNQGYNCAAKNAHEAKMAGILSGWRFRVLMLIVIVVPVCVRTLMHHPDFADKAAIVRASLDTIDNPNADIREALRHQLRTPYALAVMLPKGLLGLAVAAMLAAFISTHDTYLHSWGSIFVQDVILPFRKKPLSPRQHLWLLRFSILGVAVFIFFFSLLFQHTQYIAMFLTITGAIFIGGAGSAIIGGLYWKRGTTGAAWAAMITGMCLSLVKIGIEQVDSDTLMAAVNRPFWGLAASGMLFVKNSLTGQEMAFWAIAASVGVYVTVSLFGPRTVHNMDKLLHRGEYAIAGETSTSFRDARTLWEKLGFSRDFTGWDKIVTWITLGWPLGWTIVFVVFTIYNLVVDVPDESWLSFWHGWTWFILACSMVVTIWFAIGGIRDLRYLYRELHTRRQTPLDDGRVES